MTNLVQCKKFEANRFDKTKCQNCFKAKAVHSNHSLIENKASRSVIRCGFLSIAPLTLDLTTSAAPGRRWQRRYFVLFDDGELIYSMDDDVNTLPQGAFDMTSCKQPPERADCVTQRAYTFSFVVQCQLPSAVAGLESLPPRGEAEGRQWVTVYLCGENWEEAGRWIEALSSVLDANHKPSKMMIRTYSYGQKSVNPSHHGLTRSCTVAFGNLHTPNPEPIMRPASGLSCYPTEGIMQRSSGPCDNGSFRVSGLSPEDEQLISNSSRLSVQGSSSPPPTSHNQFKSLVRRRQHVSSGQKPRSSTYDLPSGDFSDTSSSISRSSSRSSATSRHITTPTNGMERPEWFSGTPTNGDHSWTGVAPDMPGIVPYVDSGLVPSEQYIQCQSYVSQHSANNTHNGTKISTRSEALATNNSKQHSTTRNGVYRTLTDMYLKKGWLHKKRQADKVMQRMYSILNDGLLLFFNDSNASNKPDNALDKLNLSQCLHIDRSDTQEHYGILMLMENDKIWLCALTAGIRDNWLEAISKAVEEATTGSKRNSMKSDDCDQEVTQIMTPHLKESPKPSTPKQSLPPPAKGARQSLESLFLSAESLSDGLPKPSSQANGRGPVSTNKPASTVTSSNGLAPSSPGTQGGLDKELKDVREEITRRNAELVLVKKQLAERDQISNENSQKHEDYKRTIQSHMNQLQKNLEETEKERDDLKATIQSFNKKNNNNIDSQTIEKLKEDLKQSIASSKNAEEKLYYVSADKIKFENKLKTSQKKVESLESELASQSGQVRDLEERVTELTHEVNSLRQKCREGETERERMEKLRQETEQQLNASSQHTQQIASHYQTTLSAADTEYSSLSTKNVALEKQVASLRGELDLLERQLQGDRLRADKRLLLSETENESLIARIADMESLLDKERKEATRIKVKLDGIMDKSLSQLNLSSSHPDLSSIPPGWSLSRALTELNTSLQGRPASVPSSPATPRRPDSQSTKSIPGEFDRLRDCVVKLVGKTSTQVPSNEESLVAELELLRSTFNQLVSEETISLFKSNVAKINLTNLSDDHLIREVQKLEFRMTMTEDKLKKASKSQPTLTPLSDQIKLVLDMRNLDYQYRAFGDQMALRWKGKDENKSKPTNQINLKNPDVVQLIEATRQRDELSEQVSQLKAEVMVQEEQLTKVQRESIDTYVSILVDNIVGDGLLDSNLSSFHCLNSSTSGCIVLSCLSLCDACSKYNQHLPHLRILLTRLVQRLEKLLYPLLNDLFSSLSIHHNPSASPSSSPAISFLQDIRNTVAEYRQLTSDSGTQSKEPNCENDIVAFLVTIFTNLSKTYLKYSLSTGSTDSDKTEFQVIIKSLAQLGFENRLHSDCETLMASCISSPSGTQPSINPETIPVYTSRLIATIVPLLCAFSLVNATLGSKENLCSKSPVPGKMQNGTSEKSSTPLISSSGDVSMSSMENFSGPDIVWEEAWSRTALSEVARQLHETMDKRCSDLEVRLAQLTDENKVLKANQKTHTDLQNEGCQTHKLNFLSTAVITDLNCEAIQKMEKELISLRKSKADLESLVSTQDDQLSGLEESEKLNELNAQLVQVTKEKEQLQVDYEGELAFLRDRHTRQVNQLRSLPGTHPSDAPPAGESVDGEDLRDSVRKMVSIRLAGIEEGYQKLVEELRHRHAKEINEMKQEYSKKLSDDAFDQRIAIAALQRSHEEEIECLKRSQLCDHSTQQQNEEHKAQLTLLYTKLEELAAEAVHKEHSSEGQSDLHSSNNSTEFSSFLQTIYESDRTVCSRLQQENRLLTSGMCGDRMPERRRLHNLSDSLDFVVQEIKERDKKVLELLEVLNVNHDSGDNSRTHQSTDDTDLTFNAFTGITKRSSIC